MTAAPIDRYQNFKVAIYCRVYEVRQMSDPAYLRERFDEMSRAIKINKVYLETHRDMVVAEEETLLQAKRFFESRGVQVSGGITVTVNERNRFETYCYTNPMHRAKLKEVVEYTARLFDEIILDDFFFTNCKCPSCIQAKGQQSWTTFRLNLMAAAARDLVLEPARAANPRVKVTIKYPNWYEHFQGLGFNLEVEPALFDHLYTGTETRDPLVGSQHLQQYHGYAIFRYFENLKPGGNAGGWVDPFGMPYLDRYAEQLWLTLFAKAPEVTLFEFGQLHREVKENDRAPWQNQGTSFSFDQAVAVEANLARAAGAAFEQVDPILGLLGQPLGVAAYRPHHATGEAFLHSYLGMLGIPVEIYPEFPAQARTILLTESAKHDDEIVEKIKRQLMDGKSVVITSGLLHALQNRGISDIVELEIGDRRATVEEFLIGWNHIYRAERPVTIPQISYLTNDSWEEISCLSGPTGYPLLHSAQYAAGKLYVLTIPDNFGDLYALPPEVLNRIRETICQDLPVRLEGPSQAALFLYDNDTWIVESFRPEPACLFFVMDERFNCVEDVQTGEVLTGADVLDWRGKKTGKKSFGFSFKPHSYRVFRGA